MDELELEKTPESPDGEKLQEEVITITEKVVDETGEIADETTVVITPEVIAPDSITITLGELKDSLYKIKSSKYDCDIRYQVDTKYFDDQISTLQRQIDQIV